MIVSGQIVDIRAHRIFSGEVQVEEGKIIAIRETENAPQQYVMPGFIDSHVHIESSMLVPAQFAELAVLHGTVATVSDPHEIANVLGVDGVKFMIENGKTVPFKFFFGAPSCVPATAFETSGFVIDAAQTATLLHDKDIWYLGEMMNFPGVIFDDPEVHAKIKASLAMGKPVDGHAPLLAGEQLAKYAAAGVSTDHECTNVAEAEEKLKLGMKILIREGSAARDFDMLFPLIDKYPDHVMLCTDDCHPDELQKGHINTKVKKAIANGADVFNVLKIACINPVEHYKLPVGTLRVGDAADFVVVNDLKNFEIARVFVDGKLVAENGKTLFAVDSCVPLNNFSRQLISLQQIEIAAKSNNANTIIARDGELLTEAGVFNIKIKDGKAVSDTENDILKIVVACRYSNNSPAIGFIKGIGLKKGALACSIAHDSHNLIAVGSSDEEIRNALNKVIESKGGLAAVDGNTVVHLPLPVAGLMSDRSGSEVAALYHNLNMKAAELGSTLRAPFMTMAFMALLVIPALKLGDKGLFDAAKFEFTDLFV